MALAGNEQVTDPQCYCHVSPVILETKDC